ncbi:MAG: SDR family NAD(P)-dependent oxidoreductase [Moorea sp. SIO3I7]|uniref:SDR family NAD(P)-dependent oxidoreductase n=1 Tax=Moorena TaxID=1155738 RepID=UPI0013CBFBF2|nr:MULTISPECIES: SDR family NAD(P)-dependent oxidoreductase [unclassified Moorena]NEN99486.1 SDR family NAD(P)-dependent oxidoreductase [Moorena sp. SIO3I7]NEO43534.1 SDR family NAD(P)-dependent oxidoreductase [Moorena sp. SIO4A3]NEO10835.1 SDR family NAD(P)-dependent oxidoreductase [Moorena sp. SIO3E8]NEO76986.1 SDR family NAD(P)-dependent oxidoreductase [Moorena sp. SIO4G3]NEP97474.1 SDR family NAD(P)-dependent oxidoreductase [Moorena sp. SIO3F7]
MTHLREAVVLITGAAGGFGQELTRQLLKAGSRLILSDLEEVIVRKRAEVIWREVGTGDVIACLGADLSSREGCESLYRQVKALNVPVDILINNAGIGLFGRMDEVPVEKWERLMQVNLLAPMWLSSLVVADMITRQKGHIVNISSVAGWVAWAGSAHYAASKFALRGFSEGLFNEIKAHNLQVTAVYPYFSRTPILQSEGYGTLAENFQRFPEDMATDPSNVVREIIQGIVHNKLHVFPDPIAKIMHILKRYFPGLLNWLTNRLYSRLKSDAG